MGLAEIHHIEITSGDPVEALAKFAVDFGADLVLTGSMGEVGMATGLLPYNLAKRLEWPAVSSVVGFAFGAQLSVVQAASGGRRRLLTGKAPAVLSIDSRAAHPRISTLTAMRSGRVIHHEGRAETHSVKTDLVSVPAKKRSIRLRPGKSAERVASAVHSDIAADDAASIIIEFLRAEGHISPLPNVTSDRSRNV